jgi:regulator of protease activity HflC (stomatin/prohibitin superfamily)
MFSSILMLLLLGAAIVLLVWRKYTWKVARSGPYGEPAEPETHSHPLWPYGLGCLFLLFIIAAFAFTVQVPAKNVGVVTTFGKVSDRNLGSGLHLIWPWQKVTTLDATIITDKFVGEQNGDDGRKGDNGLDCLSVRISDGTTACVSMVIRSQIDQDLANDLYANYRSDNVDENIFDSLIRTQLSAAASSTFRDFDPILTTNGGEVVAESPNLQSLSGDVLENMNENLADASTGGKPEVDMKSLTISFIRFSDTTEDRINDLQAEVGKTRVAEQQIETNRNQAEANRILADSVSNSPEVLVSKCIDMQIAMQQAGQTLAFVPSCWPGATNNQDVVVPAPKP